MWECKDELGEVTYTFRDTMKYGIRITEAVLSSGKFAEISSCHWADGIKEPEDDTSPGCRIDTNVELKELKIFRVSTFTGCLKHERD